MTINDIRTRLDVLHRIMADSDNDIAVGAMVQSESTVVTWGELRALLDALDSANAALQRIADMDTQPPTAISAYRKGYAVGVGAAKGIAREGLGE